MKILGAVAWVYTCGQDHGTFWINTAGLGGIPMGEGTCPCGKPIVKAEDAEKGDADET